jgi:hypothetical protein
VIATAGIAILSGTAWAVAMGGGMDWTWIRRTRWATGATMLMAGMGMILWPATG